MSSKQQAASSEQNRTHLRHIVLSTPYSLLPTVTGGSK